ncbi:MAG: outer membrane protein assembly factor BamB [Thiomargarita sp.]|nr:outer membrane protein assembly factor BamB [Thiomargarita sp.]
MTRVILLFIPILFIGCSQIDKTVDPPTPLVDFTPSIEIKTLWSSHIKGGKYSKPYLKLAPTFYNERLFIASPTGVVQALQLHDGKVIWQQELNLSISGGPGVANELVIVGSKKGEVIALSAENGTEIWRSNVTSEILAKPLISQDLVVIKTGDGKLFALDSKTGKRIWVYERNRMPLLSLRGISSPIAKFDLVIAGFDNGKVAFLDLHEGNVLKEFAVASPKGRTIIERMVDIDADPILIDDIVYVSSYQGKTIAIDIIRGKLLWESKISSQTGLGINLDYLYISDEKSHLSALERFSGEVWWKQDKLAYRKITAPASIGNYVVVGDFAGYLHWITQKNGQFAARFQMNNPIIVPPLVIDNNMLIVYDTGGYIKAFSIIE